MSTRIGYIDALQTERSGFEFDNAKTNHLHASLGLDVKSKAVKTGTTICGVKCKDGVVLAADTRATMGTVVSDKNCQKLHFLTDNIWCAGAGVAADLMHVTAQLGTDMRLFQLNTKRLPRIQTCIARLTQQLFKYQGHVSVALILGGVDATGANLHYVSPHGYTHASPYLAMGSGGYFASSILEAGYRDDLTLQEATDLAADAIQAGVMNDMGSGSHVDVVRIRCDAATTPELIRPYRRPVAHHIMPLTPQVFKVGTTVVLSETRTPVAPVKPKYKTGDNTATADDMVDA